jgi:hypothetical protein
MGRVVMGDASLKRGIKHCLRRGAICTSAKLHGAKGKAACRGAIKAGENLFHPCLVPPLEALGNGNCGLYAAFLNGTNVGGARLKCIYKRCQFWIDITLFHTHRNLCRKAEHDVSGR